MINNFALKKLMDCFKDSYITHNFELILYPKTNLYISLEDNEGINDLIAKLLEYCSRDCFKTQPFKSNKRNQRYHDEILGCLNKFLFTDFTEKDIELIYQKLGNGINHELTEKFINSDFDLDVLRSDEK